MIVPEPSDDFLEATRRLGVELDDEDLRRLRAYLDLLYRANETMNLTSVPLEQAWTRHLLDSLTLVPALASMPGADPSADAAGRAAAPTAAGPSVLDVGSGGGLPGIPLAIALSSIAPAARVTLLETTGKKARFLEQAIESLALANARVVQARAESAAHDRDRHRERYDAVVSRAVGALQVLVELTLPFARPGGFVLAIKGAKALEEVEHARHAIGLLGGSLAEAERTPTGTIVRIEKVSRTPRTYPRSPGEPARSPIRPPRERSPRERSP